MRPPIRVKGPDGSAITDGPRVPLILISPYAKTYYISHEIGNHSSVVKFIDTVFGLPPLALLPDEAAARTKGKQSYQQTDLGPEDALTVDVTNLLNAFSIPRLKGQAASLPPYYVKVDERLIQNLPPKTGFGCANLGIITTDRLHEIRNEIPSDFNPRPGTVPSAYSAPSATGAP